MKKELNLKEEKTTVKENQNGAETNNRKNKYLSLTTNNINYGIEDFLTEEEVKSLSDIVWKIWNKGCELKVGYMYNQKID